VKEEREKEREREKEENKDFNDQMYTKERKSWRRET
jgi:hypothetical protein